MSEPNTIQPDPDDTEDVFEPAPVDPKVERFLGGAVGRIRHTMLILGAIATLVAWWIWGWRIAAGVLLGCVVSYVNFHWLERALNSLGRAHNCCWIKGFEHGNGVPVPAALCLYRHWGLCYIQRFC